MSGCTKITINPFTGKLDVYKDEVQFANNVVETRMCLSSAQVGELVVDNFSINTKYRRLELN